MVYNEYGKSYTEKGYAKINLYLDIIAKRKDGFHDLESIMQSISLCDQVRVTLTSSPEYRLLCNVAEVPTDESNIAIKAARAFFFSVGYSGGVEIEIHKEIPMQAGLAGGSADAAATLMALNAAFKYPLDEQKLLQIGAGIGSDVPFCIRCGTVVAESRGESMRALPELSPSVAILVAHGGDGMSTPEAYAMLDAAYDDFCSYKPHGMENIEEAIQKDGQGIGRHLFNIFEGEVLRMRPAAQRIFTIMKDMGGDALMSGSGTAVFALFDSEESAQRAADILIGEGCFARICSPVGRRSTQKCERADK